MSDETPTDDAQAPAEATEPEIPVAAETPVTPPVAEPVAVPAAEPARGAKTVAVPRWVLVGLAALIGAAAMFGIGYAVGDAGNDSDSTAVDTPFPNLPNNPNFPNRNPNRQIPEPQRPSQPGSGAFLGVATEETDDGLEITQVVPGSAAADAGLRVGDVITEFDGNDVTTSAQLAREVAALDPGDDAEITYARDGSTRTVTVELGSRGTANSN